MARDVSAVQLLDRLLEKGVVLARDVTISVAGWTSSTSGDAPLHVTAVGTVAAVHSPAPEPPPATTAENLWCHQTVTEQLMVAGAGLPTRFGTVLPGVARLRALLDRNAAVIEPALDRVRGLVELGVRARWEPADRTAPPARPSPRPRESGRDYLLRRVEELQGERAPLGSLR